MMNLKHFPQFIASAELGTHMETIAFSDSVRNGLTLFDELARLKYVNLVIIAVWEY
jgi:hypothetical protein